MTAFVKKGTVPTYDKISRMSYETVPFIFENRNSAVRESRAHCKNGDGIKNISMPAAGSFCDNPFVNESSVDEHFQGSGISGSCFYFQAVDDIIWCGKHKIQFILIIDGKAEKTLHDRVFMEGMKQSI